MILFATYKYGNCFVKLCGILMFSFRKQGSCVPLRATLHNPCPDPTDSNNKLICCVKKTITEY